MEKNLSPYDIYIGCTGNEYDNIICRMVEKKLRNYVVHTKGKLGRKRLNIYCDQDISSDAGTISEERLNALKNSRYLLIICTSAAGKSDKLIQLICQFKEQKKAKNVLSLLVEGEPEDAFPKELRVIKEVHIDETGQVIETEQEVEPLAADIRSETLKGSQKLLKTEILRILAPLIGCSFEELRQTRRERRIRNTTLIMTIILLTLCFLSLLEFAFWKYAEHERNKVNQVSVETENKEYVYLEQIKIAEAAFHSIYAEAPVWFVNNPDAYKYIKEVLDQYEKNRNLPIIRQEKEVGFFQKILNFFGKQMDKSYFKQLIKNIFQHFDEIGKYVVAAVTAIIGGIVAFFRWIYYKWNLREMQGMKRRNNISQLQGESKNDESSDV